MRRLNWKVTWFAGDLDLDGDEMLPDLTFTEAFEEAREHSLPWDRDKIKLQVTGEPE